MDFCSTCGDCMTPPWKQKDCKDCSRRHRLKRKRESEDDETPDTNQETDDAEGEKSPNQVSGRRTKGRSKGKGKTRRNPSKAVKKKTPFFEKPMPVEDPWHGYTYASPYPNSILNNYPHGTKRSPFAFAQTPMFGYYDNNITPTPGYNYTGYNYNGYANAFPNIQPQFHDYCELVTPTSNTLHSRNESNAGNALNVAEQHTYGDAASSSWPYLSQNNAETEEIDLTYSPLSKHIGIFEEEHSKVTKPVFERRKYNDFNTTSSPGYQEGGDMFDSMSPFSEYNWKGGFPPGCTPPSEDFADNDFVTFNNTPPLAKGARDSRTVTPKDASGSQSRESNAPSPFRSPSPLSNDDWSDGMAAPRGTPTSAYSGRNTFHTPQGKTKGKRASTECISRPREPSGDTFSPVTGSIESPGPVLNLHP
ncbi:hypothetical protein Daesc_009061 [Daldinia eschscholtzii]|uniref:Uncharacterized protein n=1 Tax=Daldinia eschscholtzii TaxID=292717 RepID=A0AAX6M8K6_9PEZI